MTVSVLAQPYEEIEDSFPHISLTSHSICQRQRVPKDMSVYYIYFQMWLLILITLPLLFLWIGPPQFCSCFLLTHLNKLIEL